MILLYAAEQHRVVESLQQVVMETVPYHPLVYCRSLQVLEQRLRRPCHDVDLLLISVSDAIEMRQLIAMRTLLLDMRLVLVLPAPDPDIIAWAHKLGPRFIAYADAGCDPIAAVLDKMLNTGRVIQFPVFH